MGIVGLGLVPWTDPGRWQHGSPGTCDILSSLVFFMPGGRKRPQKYLKEHTQKKLAVAAQKKICGGDVLGPWSEVRVNWTGWSLSSECSSSLSLVGFFRTRLRFSSSSSAR